jgi:hypothetical protein
MTSKTRPARNPLAALGAMFARKPAPPPVKATATHADMNSMLDWPWALLHDLDDAPFGPLTPHAVTGMSGDWQMHLNEDGLRLSGNTDPGVAMTIAGAIPGGLASLRITAEIDIHHIRGDGGLIAMVVAGRGNDRLIMGFLCEGEIAVFRLNGNEVEMIGQCTPAPHASGRGDRLTLQALVFGAEAVLYVNGQYIGTSSDPVLIGQSEGAGFQAKGDTDVTLRRFTVDTVRPPARN